MMNVFEAITTKQLSDKVKNANYFLWEPMYFSFQTQVLSKQFSTAFYFALFIFLSEQFFFLEKPMQ
jgi:hypothetical protein